MDTGSTFHKFSTNKAKDILGSMTEHESAREPFKEVHFHLCVIVHVLNSQHQQINVSLHKELYT